MPATQKIVNLGLVIVGAAVFMVLVNVWNVVWNIASLPRMVDWPVTPQTILSFVMALGGVIFTRRHDVANRFLNEVTVELSKVTWPNRNETAVSTGISCILVGICALILFLFDTLWGTVLRGLFAI